VVAALVNSFAPDVVIGNKSVKVKADGNRRNVDVVVATQFRRYYSASSGLQYVLGICFFTPSGVRIVNYPKQHSTNCTSKHQGTKEFFKPMVRILKNMRSKLLDDKVIKPGSAPSYFLEGLLYNVPKDKFGSSYNDTFVAAINWLLEAKQEDLVCANEQYYLVRDSTTNCWPIADYEGFLSAVVALWNDWK
jgi:hypothetical protein